jgi:hypothetical protein
MPAGAARLHPRPSPDRLQIVYGLLCTCEGLPMAVEAFDAMPPTQRPTPSR